MSRPDDPPATIEDDVAPEPTARLNPDDLARLEEERDFLLRSIGDLDREHEVGDVSDEDYAELRDGYVARAVATLHLIEGDVAARRETPAGRGGTRRIAVAVVGVVLLCAVAGVLLAKALGSRGEGTITGSGSNPNDRRAHCRTVSFQRPAEGVTCYAAILRSSPDDVESLTYGGWAKVRAGDTSGGRGDFDPRWCSIRPTPMCGCSVPRPTSGRGGSSRRNGNWARSTRSTRPRRSRRPCARWGSTSRSPRA
ncbi:MAG: hypothetical protein R2698_08840 [Microthrixaceae bacterium]